MGEENVGALKRGAEIPSKSALLEHHKTIQSVAEGEATPVISVPSILKPKISLALQQPVSANVEMPVRRKDTETVKRAWNTEKLGLRLGTDAIAAGCAGALVAPVITMIDKGIIENASGRNTLKESLKISARELLLRPHRFITSKPFALIFSLYFGTYLTANTIDTAHSTLHSTPASTTTAGTSKFLATSSANLALCLYKDNKFTQLFASPTSPARRAVPIPTFALFTLRDCLTIFASFNLPPLLAPNFSEHMSEGAKQYVSGASVAQFVIPAAVQIVSTPLHLLGLDLFNRTGVNWTGEEGRIGQVVRNWGVSALARMCRIVPAFGIGGVVNARVRREMMEKLE